MKTLTFTALISLMLASSAMAGGLSVTFPNLSYPPVQDTTVTKETVCKPSALVTCGVDE